MISIISNKLLVILMKNGLISESDKEIYRFGLYQTISFLLNTNKDRGGL